MLTTEEKIHYVMDRLDALIPVIEDKEALTALAGVDALRDITATMLKDSVLLLQDARDTVNDHVQSDTVIMPVDKVLVLLNDLAEIETTLENGESIDPALDKDDMEHIEKRISLHVSGITCTLIDQGVDMTSIMVGKSL